jgi:hypothetical protein
MRNGVSRLTGKVAVRTRLPRWRRSVDRARLWAYSLQTGNFTGKYCSFEACGDYTSAENPCAAATFGVFPKQINSENNSENRESSQRIRELMSALPHHLDDRLCFKQQTFVGAIGPALPLMADVESWQRECRSVTEAVDSPAARTETPPGKCRPFMRIRRHLNRCR